VSLKEDPKKYILVTGTPRSGTTWVGKMLSANGTTGYIHEPFNHINARIHDSPIKYRHRYIDEKVELEQDGIFKKYLDYYFDPSWRFLFKSISKLSNVDSRYIVPFRQILRNFSDYPVSVIKDPFALLSAEWLHQTYNCEVVIVIRHPAAYALSMKQVYFKVKRNY